MAVHLFSPESTAGVPEKKEVEIVLPLPGPGGNNQLIDDYCLCLPKWIHVKFI